MNDGKTHYCSFCGKGQHEVGNLIAGPTVFICDECVVVCIEIVAAKGYEQTKAAALERMSDAHREELLDFIRFRLGYSKKEIARPFANVREEDQPRDDTGWVFCSFCDKPHHEVGSLMSRGDILICNECTMVAVKVLATKDFEPPITSGQIRIDRQLRDELYTLIRERLGYSQKE